MPADTDTETARLSARCKAYAYDDRKLRHLLIESEKLYADQLAHEHELVTGAQSFIERAESAEAEAARLSAQLGHLSGQLGQVRALCDSIATHEAIAVIIGTTGGAALAGQVLLMRKILAVLEAPET